MYVSWYLTQNKANQSTETFVLSTASGNGGVGNAYQIAHKFIIIQMNDLM